MPTGTALPIAQGMTFPVLALALAAATLSATPSAAHEAPVDCQSLLLAPETQGGGREALATHPQSGQVDARYIATVEELAAAISAAAGMVTLIRGGDFGGQDMSLLGGAFANLCFLGTGLAETGWTGASLPGSAFIDSDLSNASFAGAHLERVVLEGSTLAGTNMAGAILDGGLYRPGEAALTAGWNLAGASLHGFAFDCGEPEDEACARLSERYRQPD